jgi:hypothetical protein
MDRLTPQNVTHDALSMAIDWLRTDNCDICHSVTLGTGVVFASLLLKSVCPPALSSSSLSP